MIKKLVVLLFLLVTIKYVYADENIGININLPTDENIEKQLINVFPLLDEAKANNDLELYYRASVNGYNIKKTGNPANVKIYNDVLSASAIEYSLQRYQLTKDKKYLKRAYKWSRIAIHDRTSQIYSIRADIILASLYLDPKEMSKAYDLYRAVDLKGANNFQDEYLESYQATKEYIKNRNINRRNKWIKAMKTMGYCLCVGLAGFGDSYSNSYKNYNSYNSYNTTVRTHCYTIGDHLYCNSY